MMLFGLLVLAIFALVALGLAVYFRQQMLLYRQLLESLPDAVVQVSEDDTIQFANPQMKHLLPNIHTPMVGMPYGAILQYFKVNDHKLSPREYSPIELITPNHTVEPVEVRLGNLRLVQFRDVTHRSQIENELGLRLEQLTTLKRVYDELTATLNISTVMMLALDAAVRLSGASAGIIFILQADGTWKMSGVIGEYDPEVVSLAIQNQQGIFGRVSQRLKPENIPDVTLDPDYIPIAKNILSLMVIPLLNANSELIGMMSLATPYANRFSENVYQFTLLLSNRMGAAIENSRLYRQIEGQLAQLKDSHAQISQLEQIKTDMIRVAAHDLRNPLNAILLYLQLIKRFKGGDPERLADYLDQMGEAAKQLNRIVQDILSLERIELLTSSPPGQSHTIDLHRPIEMAFNEQRYQAEKRQLPFTLMMDPLPLWVIGDENQLFEVVTHLIQNALKFSPPERPIRVELTVKNHQAHIMVTDHGYGIPLDKQDRLFQPFYRVKTEFTRDQVGSGLGLYIVKQIVERHQGHIFFESHPDSGSRFGFTLPLVMTPYSDPASA
jgi:signal transduction histidine kinase